MIRMSAEGVANVAITRRKDMVVLTMPAEGTHGKQITIYGDGTYRLSVDGRTRTGKF